jgi:hypothetical protein
MVGPVKDGVDPHEGGPALRAGAEKVLVMSVGVVAATHEWA